MKKLILIAFLLCCLVMMIGSYFPSNNPDFAGIYIVTSAATTIELVEAFEQITTFDTDMPEDISNGDHSNDNITVGATGTYNVIFIADGEAAVNNKVYEFFVFELATSGATITGVSQATPGVVTAVAHGFSNNDRVKITGLTGAPGMVELNGNMYTVTNKANDTFELEDDNGADIATGGYGAYGSGGTATLATILPQVHAERKFAVGGDVGSFSGGGMVSLTIGKTLELWVKGTTDATNMTVDDCSFCIKRVQ